LQQILKHFFEEMLLFCNKKVSLPLLLQEEDDSTVTRESDPMDCKIDAFQGMPRRRVEEAWIECT
jgi:hypothetical protein